MLAAAIDASSRANSTPITCRYGRAAADKTARPFPAPRSTKVQFCLSAGNVSCTQSSAAQGVERKWTPSTTLMPLSTVELAEFVMACGGIGTAAALLHTLDKHMRPFARRRCARAGPSQRSRAHVAVWKVYRKSAARRPKRNVIGSVRPPLLSPKQRKKQGAGQQRPPAGGAIRNCWSADAQ